MLNGVDGRTTWARRFHALMHSHGRDLGGLDHLTEGQMALLRSGISLQIRAEQLQANVMRGEVVDPSALVKITSESRRCLERLKRTEKPKAHSLSDYLAGKGAAA
jgi:hypothetical protein